MAFRFSTASLLSLLILAGACDRDEPAVPQPPDNATAWMAGPDTGPALTPATRSTKSPRVVFLGDSLTAGFGVDLEQAFPAIVGETLRRNGLPVEVVNAGVSGDTTAGGLRRLDWLLRQKPDVVVVGLGGNDGLRGLDLKASEDNLRAIALKSREAGASVLLLGMLIPPNYGPEYATQFREVYPRVAKETGATLVPFLLEGVGGDPSLNQPDGIHPTAEGHEILAENVAPSLLGMVAGRAY